MTTTYYVPPERIKGNIVSLPEEEAHHAVQVLRHKAGDEIIAVDGEGGWYRIALERVGRKVAEGHIQEKKQDVGEPGFALTVGMAILKNQKRFDTFIEKAVELGVTRIVPLVTSRVEKKTIKAERVQKILIAAMKQCGRSRMITFDSVTPFNQVAIDTGSSLVLCCHEKADSSRRLSETLLNWQGPKDATILIGPEGGFTEEEITHALAHDVHIVSLGKRRLRAETAAIVASTGVSLLWQ